MPDSFEAPSFASQVSLCATICLSSSRCFSLGPCFSVAFACGAPAARAAGRLLSCTSGCLCSFIHIHSFRFTASFPVRVPPHTMPHTYSVQRVLAVPATPWSTASKEETQHSAIQHRITRAHVHVRRSSVVSHTSHHANAMHINHISCGGRPGTGVRRAEKARHATHGAHTNDMMHAYRRHHRDLGFSLCNTR